MYDLDQLGIENIRAVLCGDLRTRVRENAELQWRVPGEAGAADEYRTLTGYPSVFMQPTVLYSGKRYVVMEQIARGAFDDVLKDDCHLNYVHESASAMARNNLNGVGGMQLSVDEHGLRVFAQLPLDDWDVQRLAPKMDRGVVNQMSFQFYVGDEGYQVYTDEEDREVCLYTIKKVSRLLDVCVAPLGAYPTTEAALRSVFGAQLSGRALPSPGDSAGREASEGRAATDGDAAGVGSEEGRSDEGSHDAALRAEAQAAVFRFRPRRD